MAADTPTPLRSAPTVCTPSLHLMRESSVEAATAASRADMELPHVEYSPLRLPKRAHEKKYPHVRSFKNPYRGCRVVVVEINESAAQKRAAPRG